jgi:hypothetical protein
MRASICFVILMLSFKVCGQVHDSAYMILPVNSHDFGRIQEDKGIVGHTFAFRNAGTIPLIITHIRTTCGCITPSWTIGPVVPGGEGTITLNFDPSGKDGAFQKTIQVQSNASNTNMFLTISGIVIPPVKKEDLHFRIGTLNAKTNHINFGYLYKGITGVEILTVANTEQKTMQIGFDSIPEYIQMYANPPILNPGEFGQIEVHYDTDKLDDWDVIIDEVPLLLNGKYDENAKITITANIREDFSKLTPEQLAKAPVASYTDLNHSFDTITSDKPVMCRFQIRNNGESDLIIRAVKPSCGCTAVKPEKSVLSPGDSTFISTVFYPKGRTGDFKNGVTVVTNDPKLYKQYLWLEGFIRK